MFRTTLLRFAMLIGTALLVLHAAPGFTQVASPPPSSPAESATSGSAPDDYRKITDEDIQMLRKNLRSERKDVVAANLPLSSAEAEKFWPVYNQYIAELVAMNGKKYDLIKQYLHPVNTMTDAQAESAVNEWIQVDRSVADLRTKYVPLFSKVLSPKKTALFYQIDRRVQLMIDLQLASALPLVEP